MASAAVRAALGRTADGGGGGHALGGLEGVEGAPLLAAPRTRSERGEFAAGVERRCNLRAVDGTGVCVFFCVHVCVRPDWTK